MKGAVFNGKEIILKDISKPEITDSQVLIRVKTVGICGTDLAIVNGHLTTPTPLILGHEFAGEVVEIGDQVDQSWNGKRVTAEINSNIDHNCFFCNNNIFTQCISRKAIGIDINGALAEYIAIESYLLHEIPDNVSLEDATFIEPLAAAYQTFELMPIDKNDNNIVIFGLGKLGLLIAQVAKLKGLEVMAVDGSEQKLMIGKKYGISHAINRLKCKNIPDEIKKYTDKLGADIIVDTTGNPLALKDIVSSCRTRGKIHVKSTHGIDTPINFTDVVVREITIYSSRCGPFDKAIKGLESGEIKVHDLISKKYPLEKIKEAFNSYETSRHYVKTIISI